MTPNKTHKWVKDVKTVDSTDDINKVHIMHTHVCSKCGIVKMLFDVWMWSYVDDFYWRGPVNKKILKNINYGCKIYEPMPTCSEAFMHEALR